MKRERTPCVTSIIGTYMVRLGSGQSIMGALYKGFIAAGVLSIGAIAAVNYLMFGGFSASFTTVQGVTFTSGGLFACALVGEYDALPGLDATTRRHRQDARAAARPWRLDVGCPSSWRPSRGSRSRVLGRGKTTKSRAGHGVTGLCRAQPTEATRRRAGEDGAPITSAPRLDLDSQARDHCCLFVMVT